jgi:hypothetical protein
LNYNGGDCKPKLARSHHEPGSGGKILAERESATLAFLAILDCSPMIAVARHFLGFLFITIPERS